MFKKSFNNFCEAEIIERYVSLSIRDRRERNGGLTYGHVNKL